MKALVFDVGGTSIKYGICENGVLTARNEIPTEAKRGGPHILHVLTTLIEKERNLMQSASVLPDKSMHKPEVLFMPTAIFQTIQAWNCEKNCLHGFMYLSW